MWKDPVWSKVISAGILAIVGAMGATFLDWWPAIGSSIRTAWSYALLPNQLPNWLIWIVALALLPTVMVLGAVLRQTILPSSGDAGPSWRTYIQDDLLGLRWRWHYLDDGSIKGVAPFCPRCDYQVFPHHASAYGVVERIGFHCDSCSVDLSEFDESFESLRSKIERFVQQKLRTGAWRNDAET